MSSVRAGCEYAWCWRLTGEGFFCKLTPRVLRDNQGVMGHCNVTVLQSCTGYYYWLLMSCSPEEDVRRLIFFAVLYVALLNRAKWTIC